MIKPLVTPKNILRALTILCIIFFFCPVFMVSCGSSEFGRELSAFELAHGTEVQASSSTDDSYSSKLASKIVEESSIDEINKPHYVLYGLLILPVFMFLFLLVEDMRNRSVALLTLLLSTVDLASWGFFAYEVKKTAEGAMFMFKVTYWYVINMISILAILIVSFLVTNGNVRMYEDLLYHPGSDDDYENRGSGSSINIGRVKE